MNYLQWRETRIRAQKIELLKWKEVPHNHEGEGRENGRRKRKRKGREKEEKKVCVFECAKCTY